MIKFIIGLIFLAAVVGFTVWGYSAYFKTEATSIDTSMSALQSAKDTKTMLEARDRASLKTAGY